jgi:hypothetical protein
MARLKPSEWVVPHAMKSTDSAERHLHATHIHTLTLRHNRPWAITKTKTGGILPLKKLIKPSQKLNQVSDVNQVLSKSSPVSDISHVLSKSNQVSDVNQVLSKSNPVSDFNQVGLDSIRGP